MAEKQVVYDVDGYDAMTTAIRVLLNQFPGLHENDEITFSVLSEDGGKAMFPVSGAVVTRQIESVTGHVKQTCAYPFYVIYRAGGLSENRKASVKEWLDNLGKWLEKQPVTIGKETYSLEEYPTLTNGRTIKSIQRTTPSYLDSTNENMSENWAISIQVQYENEFNK